MPAGAQRRCARFGAPLQPARSRHRYTSIEQSLPRSAQTAVAVGHPERGDALVARHRREGATRRDRRAGARHGGLVGAAAMTGTGTLIDDLMQRMGLGGPGGELGGPLLLAAQPRGDGAARPTISSSATDTVADQGTEMHLPRAAGRHSPGSAFPEAWTRCGSPATSTLRGNAATQLAYFGIDPRPMTISRPPLIAGLIASLTLIAAIGASIPLRPGEFLVARWCAAFTGHGDRIAITILLELRLPRMLLGLGVGAMLGRPGARRCTGHLRNPQAEPSVLGASNARVARRGRRALFRAGRAASGGAAGAGRWAPRRAALARVGLSALAGRSESPLTLILAGIAIATLARPASAWRSYLSPNPFCGDGDHDPAARQPGKPPFEHVRIALSWYRDRRRLLLLGTVARSMR